MPADSKTEGQNLIRGLFDLSFTTFVTVKFAKIIYVLLLVGWALGWVVFLFGTLTNDEMAAAVKVLMILIVLPIGALLSLIYLRIVVESMVVIFRIAENTELIASVRGSGVRPGTSAQMDAGGTPPPMIE